MAGFLYYFPGQNVVPSADLTRLPMGLRSVLNESTWSVGHVDNFSDGSAGAIISRQVDLGGKEALAGFFPDRQKWAPVPDESGKARYWIGFETLNPPRPQDLARSRQVPGNGVILNGQEWLIPVVHAPSINPGHCTLPQVFRMTANGPACHFDPRYEKLTVESARFFNSFVLGQGQVTTVDAYKFLCDVLNVNYHIGPWECSFDVLNLVGSADQERLIMASIGVLALYEEEELKKKTTSIPSNT